MVTAWVTTARGRLNFNEDRFFCRINWTLSCRASRKYRIQVDSRAQDNNGLQLRTLSVPLRTVQHGKIILVFFSNWFETYVRPNIYEEEYGGNDEYRVALLFY